MIKKVEPVYPGIAFKARVYGTVNLEVTVDKVGRVQDVKVTRSNPLLEQAAIDAARQWVYQPMIVEGRPKKFILSIEINFNLSERKE